MKRDEIDVVVVEPGGEPIRLVVEPTLENLRGMIGGGWLEAIHGPGWAAYLDEEGKLKGLSYNVSATALAVTAGWLGSGRDYLVGTVMFLGPPDEDGDETSVTEAITRLLG